MRNPSKHFIVPLTIVLATVSTAHAAEEPLGSTGFSRNTTIVEAPGPDGDCPGPLVCNWDGTIENAYCWHFAGVSPPDYGAWAECYGEAFICEAHFYFTQTGYYTGQTLDVYVWDRGVDELPGNVIFMATGLHPGPIEYWPSCSAHTFPVNISAPNHFIGFWGNWPGEGCGWFVCADEDGFPGCPLTKYAPGIGYPTGWGRADIPPAFNPESLGLCEWAIPTGVGACCVGEECFEVSQVECQAMGGEWSIGTCDPNPCVGACCLDEECVITSEDNCIAMGGEWDGSPSCDPNPCLPLGACCVGEECFEVTEVECQAMGGNWSEGLSCHPNPCVGACCLNDECIITYEENCQAMGGEWDGSPSCHPNPCNLGACCVGEECFQVSEAECQVIGGEWDGSPSCEPNPCLPLGACCVGEECFELNEVECLAMGGEWSGGISCDPNPCVGACCMDEECIITSEENCQAMGGEWLDGPCDPNPCVGACCLDEECVLTTEENCLAIGGEWDGSPSCQPNPCLPVGACCVSGDCFLVSEPECETMGGEWDGSPSCQPNPCPGEAYFDGIVLLVQGNVQCVETNGDPCGAIETPLFCEETNPNACADESGVEWYLALIAAEEELAFNTVTFGIGDYDPVACDLAAHGPCFPELQPLEINSDGWPGPLSGTSVTWAPNCLEGTLVPVYYFGFYAYYGGGPVPLGDFYPGQSAAIVNCVNPPTEDPIVGFGVMGCGEDPGVRACPGIAQSDLGACCVDLDQDGIGETCIPGVSEETCLDELGGFLWFPETDCGSNNEPCPQPVRIERTTWGRIKTMYRD